MGEGKIGDDEIIGRFDAGTRNKKGSMVANFAKRIDLAVVNTYFTKKDKHRVTYCTKVAEKYPSRLCDAPKEGPEGNVQL